MTSGVNYATGVYLTVQFVPVTVVEMPQFIRQAEGLLSDDDRTRLIERLAWSPEIGVVMPGTGGVRKMRLGVSGRGKSGGARVIYYYRDESIPIFLLSVFPKNVKVDLSQAEKNEMRRVIPALVRSYQETTT